MSFLDRVFGGSHKHRSFPITTRGAKRRVGAAAVTGTYVVCLDCGKEFPYDWETMKLLPVKEAPSPVVPVTAIDRKVA